MASRALPENWLRQDLIVTAVAVAAGCLMAWLTFVLGSTTFATPIETQLIGCLLLPLPLIWRRSHPLASGIAVNALYIALVNTTGMDLFASQVTLFLSFYSIGAWSARRGAALAARSVISIAMGLNVCLSLLVNLGSAKLNVQFASASTLAALFALYLMINLSFFAGAWVFGDRAWQQALERQELVEANRNVKALQAELISRAIEEERLRIARELHDVVAHHVTTMSVQAAAARRLLGRDPEHTEKSLKQIEASARQAVNDLRSMVFTLRETDATEEGLPTVEDIPGLVESARLAESHVSYETIGELPNLSPAVELTLYRVAQEALTNAAKHAGPTASVAVRLRSRKDSVELEVSDDGFGMRRNIPGTGTGLTGMRERVTALGGSLEAGSKPRGGFRVRAEIPTAGATA